MFFCFFSNPKNVCHPSIYPPRPFHTKIVQVLQLQTLRKGLSESIAEEEQDGIANSSIEHMKAGKGIKNVWLERQFGIFFFLIFAFFVVLCIFFVVWSYNIFLFCSLSLYVSRRSALWSVLWFALWILVWNISLNCFFFCFFLFSNYMYSFWWSNFINNFLTRFLVLGQTDAGLLQLTNAGIGVHKLNRISVGMQAVTSFGSTADITDVMETIQKTIRKYYG